MQLSEANCSICIIFWPKVLNLDLARMLTVQTLIHIVIKYHWFQVSSSKKLC